jgi:GT2 family glycosyltransferase
MSKKKKKEVVKDKQGNPLPKPVVSIIIPVVDQAAMTVKCFQSIRANTKLPYEIIWIDNCSRPESFGVIRRQATRPRVRCKVIKNNYNVGFVKATNQGIKESKSEYIILLNNDTEVFWKWATKLIKPLMNDPTIGAVGPVTQSRIAWQQAEHLNQRWKKLGVPKFNESIKLKYHEKLTAKFAGKYINVGKLPLSFFCVAMRRSVFEEIGYLCEEFSIGLGDDDEFCMRLRANGYKNVLSLETFVYHAHRTTFTALNLGVDSLRRHNIKILRRKEKELARKAKKAKT